MAKHRTPRKKHNQFLTIILVIIAIAILFWKFGGVIGARNAAVPVSNTSVLQQLNQPMQPSSTCSLNFDTAIFHTGDTASADINGPVSTACNMYYKYNAGDWQLNSMASTNIYGHLKMNILTGVNGSYEYAAICGACVTNHDTIIVQAKAGVQNLPPPDNTKTCEQTALENNAYYTESVSTGAACLNYATIDCQQMAKTIDGYGFTNNCCYYTCTNIQQNQPLCTDSDGGQDDQHLILGTVTDPDGSYTDYCWGDGRLAELYCENGDGKLMVWQCDTGMVCRLGVCDLTMCEDIMNADEQSDCEGHPTTDGGVCAYWAGQGCLSSFDN